MSFVQDQKEQTEPTEQVTEAQAPEVKPTFAVGDRTYDVDAAAKKIEHADKHISDLEAELAQLRAKVEQQNAEEAKAKALEEALKGKKEEETTKSEPVDVDRLIEEKLAMKEQEQLAKQTFAETSKALVDQFGAENVDAAVSEKMAAVGKTLEDAMRMAQDPSDAKVLMALLGSGAKSQPKPTFSGHSVSGVSSSTVESNDTVDAIWKSRHGGKMPDAHTVRDTMDSIAREMGFKAYDPKQQEIRL